MEETSQELRILSRTPTDQPNSAICLFEGWKIEGRDLQNTPVLVTYSYQEMYGASKKGNNLCKMQKGQEGKITFFLDKKVLEARGADDTLTRILQL